MQLVQCLIFTRPSFIAFYDFCTDHFCFQKKKYLSSLQRTWLNLNDLICGSLILNFLVMLKMS